MLTKKCFFLVILLFSLVAKAELQLSDLEFKTEEIKVDPKVTAMMEERHRKLQLHQKLGLATMVAMSATLALSASAASNNAHKYAGIATGLLYWTTAYYTWTAPKPESVVSSGSTRIHRALAWIHAPLMVIVPVLGYMYKEDLNKGKTSNSLVKAHGGLANAAYASFMAAGLVMYFDF